MTGTGKHRIDLLMDNADNVVEQTIRTDSFVLLFQDEQGEWQVRGKLGSLSLLSLLPKLGGLFRR